VDGAEGGGEIGSAQNPRRRKKTKQDSGKVDLAIDSSLRGGLCEFKEVISHVEGEGDIEEEDYISENKEESEDEENEDEDEEDEESNKEYDEEKIIKWLSILKEFGPGNYCLLIVIVLLYIE
jgi:hypothetical protein